MLVIHNAGIHMCQHSCAGLQHVVRFVESFETRRLAGRTSAGGRHTGAGAAASSSSASGAASAHGVGFWLVFRDEGVSLSDLLYEPLQPPPGEAGAQAEDGDGGDEAENGDGDDEAEGDGDDGDDSGGDEAEDGDGDDRDGGGGGASAAGGSGSGESAFSILGPSRWWHALRDSPDGPDTIRSLLRQSLLALDALHMLNVSSGGHAGIRCSRAQTYH